MVPTAFLGHPASTELCTLTEVIMLRIYMYTLYKKKNNGWQIQNIYKFQNKLDE